MCHFLFVYTASNTWRLVGQTTNIFFILHLELSTRCMTLEAKKKKKKKVNG